MFGGGGMNPRKMKQMMEQMGIDVTELDADRVVIYTDDEELVFEGPQVTRMDAQGQQTYQIVGEPTVSEDEDGSTVDDGSGTDGRSGGVPEEDVEIVAQRAGASTDDARAALEAEDGDLAAAIDRLS